MIQLHQNEEPILIIRKHWIVLLEHSSIILFLLLVPVVGYPFINVLSGLVVSVFSNAEGEMLTAFLNLFLVLYTMMVLAAFLFIFMDYYLDMWIVTNRRILDVEQRGLFSRRIAEIPLSSVQDVTIDIHGILRTLLKFGTIKIQTAGEREYIIKDVPHLTQIKDAMLAYVHRTQEHREAKIKD